MMDDIKKLTLTKQININNITSVTYLTFLNLHREHIHLLHSLLQFIFCRCCNWIHIIVSPIIFIIGEGTKDLYWSKIKILNTAPAVLTKLLIIRQINVEGYQ